MIKPSIYEGFETYLFLRKFEKAHMSLNVWKMTSLRVDQSVLEEFDQNLASALMGSILTFDEFFSKNVVKANLI